MGGIHVASHSTAQRKSEIVAGIVEVLTKLDTLTDEAQRAIGLLQERLTTLISAAVTGQIDVRTVTGA